MTKPPPIPDVVLGCELGSGTSVSIPVRNMAVTGQTQEAGKTTALEALIARSGLRAVTFVTKRGEGSFTTARRIDPYFREQADWQFVASILEASRGEKLKFERAWIIRASKGARTLADVQRNVLEAMKTAKGMSADVYLTLDAYLEAVVPAIARVSWAPRLELNAGVNAMDLTSIPTELQHLVIKSSIDWVLERETATVVVVPEAWKFIPQGRNTPVKLSAEAYIRQGSGLRNYLWLDSQDIGGIEKQILRSVPVWILGVQREVNEIKRTLDNIPAGISKPSKADIATLELGQFVACWGRHAIKTYVQPSWMTADMARSVAVGQVSIDQVQRHEASIQREARAVARRFGVKEDTVTPEDAARLTRENDSLRSENADLRRRLEALERSHEQTDRGRADHAVQGKGPEPDARAVAGSRRGDTVSPVRATPAGVRAFTAEETFDNERLYQAFKARLIDEAPAIIQMLVTRPEIEMTIARKTVQVDEYSLKGRIARLLKEGFFAEPRGCGAVRGALKRTGPDANTANIGRALDDFTRDGFVTDEGGAGYREVAGMKVNVIEARA